MVLYLCLVFSTGAAVPSDDAAVVVVVVVVAAAGVATVFAVTAGVSAGGAGDGDRLASPLEAPPSFNAVAMLCSSRLKRKIKNMKILSMRTYIFGTTLIIGRSI